MLKNTITLKRYTNLYGLEPLKKHFRSPPRCYTDGRNQYGCNQLLLQLLPVIQMTLWELEPFLIEKRKYPNPIMGIPIISDLGIEEDIQSSCYSVRRTRVD
ncbi:hypothetical protein RF11_08535 [Thelohanellus kitauei]|uniref:Uncharacterized protein n=1 Tax=Thelohanellus kitauei TaxID=669202 RepID=A0A0C2MRY7_THEKT|nr:hypothetical protein RF11_08535 [Thelohanellus kitauei]